MSIYVELEEKTLMETLDKLIQACFASLDIFCQVHTFVHMLHNFALPLYSGRF